MNKQLFTLMCIAFLSTDATAQNLQTTTINGTATDKQVTRITLTGDRLHLTFADQTETDCTMKALSIDFKKGDTGIDVPNATQRQAAGTGNDIYNMGGQRTRTDRKAKGLYVVGGKKQVVK
jgi:phage tail sheath gpL-like